MAKSAVAIETKADLSNAFHLVTQKKGGVGKSVTAGWVTEYLKQKHGTVLAFDTDPSNQTFARFKALQVRSVEILEKDEIQAGLFDPMIETAIQETGPALVDTGSSSFYSLWNYIIKNDLFSFLSEQGRPVVIHIPLAPKPDLEDTLEGFDHICRHAPSRSVVVWINERENAISLGGKSFFDLDVAAKNEDKLLGVVVNSKQQYELHRLAVGTMLTNHWTFAEACSQLDTLARLRLRQVQKEIFEQLEQLGL